MPRQGRLVHNWLFHKNLNTFIKSGPAYQEGKGTFCFLCKPHKIFNTTPCEQFMRWSSNTKILSSLKYRDKSLLFHFKKVQKKKLEMISYLRHTVQHTGLSKRKFEFQISYLWLIWQHYSDNNFQYSAQGSTGELFLVLSSCHDDTCWGRYRVLITLVSHGNICTFPVNKTENTETHSLWIKNVLKNYT